MKDQMEVNVVAFREGDLWVAQCIEYDIAARSKSFDDLREKFERTFMANLCVSMELGRMSLEGIGPAPLEILHMYEAAKESMVRKGAKPASSKGVRIKDMRLVA